MTRYATFLFLLLVTSVGYGQLDLTSSDSLSVLLKDTFPLEINFPEITFGPCEKQTLPIYKGCQDATPTEQMECLNRELSEFIKKKIRVPKELKDTTFTAKVYVSMVIDENALVTRIRIERSSIRDLPETMKSQAHLLDNEAIRVVSKLKFVEPPIIGTKPTRMRFTVPIRYSNPGK